MTLIIDDFGPGSMNLAALGIDLAQGLQLHSAATLSALYHPALNPGQPALLNGLDDLARVQQLKRVLLNQYPATHEVRLVQPRGEGDPLVHTLPLAQIDAADVFVPGMLLIVPTLDALGSFESLQETMAHLRSPEGCPWDREQTHDSLRPYLLEETYEVLETLDAGDPAALEEELGDVLLQIAFHVQIAVENGTFHMADVIAHINRKLIHRHPHVWGAEDVDDAAAVTRNWEAIKKQERRDNGKARASLLDGISKALPALAQAYNYQERAARIGFDWQEMDGVLAKIQEEIAEVESAPDEAARAAEIGDLFFALVNWARWVGVEPETVLREANARFYRRFHYIELAADQAGKPLADFTLDEMDALWDAAKATGL